ncbi:UNVERIFIED_CONTAM: hypothetical protein Slati_2390900 [Sesamum latifolium]|uniref:Transposase n=1 Tax=Sesamum latifolium TaxID=2727402 RepID=A0AAW2WCP2_9LAMI
MGYRDVRDVLVYVEILGELNTGHGNEGVHETEEGEMGRMDDADLYDSDYDLSTEVDDDDRLFDDYVDDKTDDIPTSDIPINNNRELIEGLSGFSDEGESDIMDEIRRTNPGSTVVIGTEDARGKNKFNRFHRVKGNLGVVSHIVERCLGIEEQSKYVFMSDKQKGLIQAFQEVLPDAAHRFCVRYMHNNFKSAGFRGLSFKHALWRAAKVCTKEEFKAIMMDIQAVEQWSRSHFNVNLKCDMLLDNCCENFNMMILDAREKLILTMLEWIRKFLMRRLQENRDLAETKWKERFCPRIKKILDKHVEKVADCIPIKVDNFHYQISCFDGSHYAVDLANHTCTCRKWELSGIPSLDAFGESYGADDVNRTLKLNVRKRGRIMTQQSQNNMEYKSKKVVCFVA